MSLGDNRSESTIVVGEYNSKVLLYSRQRDRDLSLIQKPNESCVKTHVPNAIFFRACERHYSVLRPYGSLAKFKINTGLSSSNLS